MARPPFFVMLGFPLALSIGSLGGGSSGNEPGIAEPSEKQQQPDPHHLLDQDQIELVNHAAYGIAGTGLGAAIGGGLCLGTSVALPFIAPAGVPAVPICAAWGANIGARFGEAAAQWADGRQWNEYDKDAIVHAGSMASLGAAFSTVAPVFKATTGIWGHTAESLVQGAGLGRVLDSFDTFEKTGGDWWAAAQRLIDVPAAFIDTALHGTARAVTSRLRQAAPHSTPHAAPPIQAEPKPTPATPASVPEPTPAHFRIASLEKPAPRVDLLALHQDAPVRTPSLAFISNEIGEGFDAVHAPKLLGILPSVHLPLPPVVFPTAAENRARLPRSFLKLFDAFKGLPLVPIESVRGDLLPGNDGLHGLVYRYKPDPTKVIKINMASRAADDPALIFPATCQVVTDNRAALLDLGSPEYDRILRLIKDDGQEATGLVMDHMQNAVNLSTRVRRAVNDNMIAGVDYFRNVSDKILSAFSPVTLAHMDKILLAKIEHGFDFFDHQEMIFCGNKYVPVTDLSLGPLRGRLQMQVGALSPFDLEDIIPWGPQTPQLLRWDIELRNEIARLIREPIRTFPLIARPFRPWW